MESLKVEVQVIDMPENHVCKLQIKEELHDDLTFELTWKGEQASGPAVVRNPDGRRFVYLVWLDNQGKRVGRIKLWVDQIAPPGSTGTAKTTIPGKDAKGRPACATVKGITTELQSTAT